MRNSRMITLALFVGSTSFVHPFVVMASVSASAKIVLKEKTAKKSDVLLDIDGKIYPNDHFPDSCKEMLRGVKCDAKAFGFYHVEAKKDGDQIYSKATFSDSDSVQVTEQSWEKDGHVTKAIIENKATQKLSELEVKDGKVHYRVTDKKDGSVKTADEDAPNNLVVPSTVMSYIRPFHAELSSGKEVTVKVAVLDRRESFTFHIKKIRDEKSADGEAVMVLEMSAASIIVKALVDPMYFYVKSKSGEMFAFEGKSALRRKEGEKYKEIVVKATYQYNVNQFKVAERSKVVVAGESCSEEMMKAGEVKCSVPTTESNSSSKSSP